MTNDNRYATWVKGRPDTNKDGTHCHTDMQETRGQSEETMNRDLSVARQLGQCGLSLKCNLVLQEYLKQNHYVVW